MNRIVISGNICNDLEIKTSGETKILNFTIATRRKFKDKNGEYPTDFIKCVSFNNQGEFISKYFKKGSPILVEGSLQTNNYETENGEKRTNFNIVVENVDFFGSRNNNENNQEVKATSGYANTSFEQTMQNANVPFTTTTSDNELPF